MEINEEKFAELFANALRRQSVKEGLKEIMQESLEIKLNELETKVTQAEEKVTIMQEKYEVLEKKYKEIEEKLNKQEQTAQKNNIIIDGLEENQKTPRQNVKELFQKIGQEVPDSDIEEVFRLGKKEKDKMRKIIVKFSNRHAKDCIYKARTKLKGEHFNNQTVYFNEDLPHKTQELFFKTRKLAKDNRLKAAWTYNGQIYIKKGEKDTPVHIADNEKLEEYGLYLELVARKQELVARKKIDHGNQAMTMLTSDPRQQQDPR